MSAQPLIAAGSSETLTHSPDAPGHAILTRILRPDELEPPERLPALGSLLHALIYRLSQEQRDTGDLRDLAAIRDAPLPALSTGQNQPAITQINGRFCWASSWNHAGHRSLFTIDENRWVAVLLPAGDTIVRLESYPSVDD